MALAWTLRLPTVTSALIGASSVSHNEITDVRSAKLLPVPITKSECHD